MKTEKRILVAFLLNLAFAVFELVGGFFTGSVAILSDALHDMGDAASIGTAYFLEKKSKRPPDKEYTYGYARYSLLGSLITTTVLLLGSALVVWSAVNRIFTPTEIHYNGMIVFAVVGVSVNFGAALLTREGGSLNQKAVNLHMLEDVLGWVIVLIGAIVMKFTDFSIIDPLMTFGVALFIIVNAVKNLKEVFSILLEKAPCGISTEEIKEHLLKIDGIADVHHIHIWSLDGQSHLATMHAVTSADSSDVKKKIKDELREHGIMHSTIELEKDGEDCTETDCQTVLLRHNHHHHHCKH